MCHSFRSPRFWWCPQYLHKNCIVHRDLKLENMLLSRDGYVKLADFGFAKKISCPTYTICGTPEYLAPEIFLQQGHCFPVDWWAVAIITFKLLTGTTPFHSPEAKDIYQKAGAGYVEYPSAVSGHSKNLISKLLVDQSRRLGRKGAADVKSHRWFSGTNWNALLARQVLAPYVPDVSNSADTSKFDSYPESAEDSAPIPALPEQELFEGF
mmetsp:Transcript_54690/g.125590  ORF Transcript_54690/g.125590 Transcript_54690/m.125590 type:complete len:210 (+) Transcript_54690:20-649(+)